MNTDSIALIITVEFHERDIESYIFDDTYNYLSTMLKDLTLYHNKRVRDNGNIYISTDEYTKTATIALTITYPDDNVESFRRMKEDMNSFNNFSYLNDLPMLCQHYSVVKWSERNCKNV